MDSQATPSRREGPAVVAGLPVGAAATTGVLGPTGRPMPDFPAPAPLAGHGPARVIAMCNQKGGVGKTTTTINLGAALAEYGRRVLLVDFDPQGALSVGLGLPTHELDVTIYNLLRRARPRCPRHHPADQGPGLDVLPANIDLSAAEVQLVGEVAREQALVPGAAPGPGRLRRRPHRLPALARPAHRQRPHRRARSPHPAGVRVLRHARRRAARRDDREDHRPAQPAAAGRRHPARRCTTAGRCTRGRSSQASSSTSATRSSTRSSAGP